MSSAEVPRSWGITLLVALVVLAVLLGQRAVAPFAATDEERPAPGNELVLVFIASPTCAAATDDSFPSALRAIRDTVTSIAASRGVEAVMLGVGIGGSVRSSLEFLDQFGPWDEVSVGRGWLNTAAVRFIWDTHAGNGGVPQVLVMARRFARGPFDNSVLLQHEQLLARKVGLGEIYRWVERGAPIPRVGPAAE
jgi:hypothetical protein